VIWVWWDRVKATGRLGLGPTVQTLQLTVHSIIICLIGWLILRRFQQMLLVITRLSVTYITNFPRLTIITNFLANDRLLVTHYFLDQW
jgi:hypothetical protein